MNCTHTDTHPLWLDGLCIDCWKARAEKAEAELETRKRCHKENEAAYAQMRERAERADAAAAEMRLIIMSFHNDIESGEISPSEPFVLLLEHALSSDAGKGWVPPEEHARLLEVVRAETEKRSMEACIVSQDIAKSLGWMMPDDAAKLTQERNEAIAFTAELESRLAIAVEALEKIQIAILNFGDCGHTFLETDHAVNTALAKLKEDKA